MTDRQRREPHFGPAPAEPPAPPPIDGPLRDAAPRRIEPQRDFPTWTHLGIGAAAVLATLILVPMAIEEVGGPCRALEIRAMALNMAGSRNPGSDTPIVRGMARAMSRELATGEIAASYMKERAAGLPSGAGCAGQYWLSLLNPAALQIGNLSRNPRRQ